MALDHFIQPTVPDDAGVACRLGAGNTANDRLTTVEERKFAKLVGESRYDLCAVGDAIEGWIYAVEVAPQNGYTIGSVVQRGRQRVIFDGTQAAGTGAIAIGTYVVAGTPVAKGTSLGQSIAAANTYPKVRSATSQTPGAYNWRVVSLGQAGTGAVGTVGVIERI